MTSPASPKRSTAPTAGTLKKLVLTLAVSVVVLDAVMIGGYYAFHIGERTVKAQQSYAGVWIVLTLMVVLTLMKRIRRVRGRR